MENINATRRRHVHNIWVPDSQEAERHVWDSAVGYCFEQNEHGFYVTGFTQSAAIKAGGISVPRGCNLLCVTRAYSIGEMVAVALSDSLPFTAMVNPERPIYARSTDVLDTFLAGIERYASVPGARKTLIEIAHRITLDTPPWDEPRSLPLSTPSSFIMLKGVDRAPRQRRRLRPPAKRPVDDGHQRYFITPSDRINNAAIAALAPGAMQSMLSRNTLKSFGIPESAPRYWQAYPFSGNEKRQAGAQNTVCGLIGLPNEPEAAIWELLQKNGALAVKAQYALWARAYADTDAASGQWVVLSIPQFCDDLGYKRRKDGTHEIYNKQKAMDVLRLLTSIEVCCYYTRPEGGNNGKQKTSIVHGALWNRGMTRLDGYADLFGNAGEGDPSMWDPVAFSYAPGPWFSDANWRSYNRNVTLVGAGLLALDSRKDQWPIMIGGYIATRARINGYRKCILRAETVLKKSGLANADVRHPNKQRDRLERALDKIREMDNPIIGGWQWANEDTEEDTEEEPDMDDPETLASLADTEQSDWRKRRIIISWPDDLSERAKALQEKREQRQEETYRRLFGKQANSHAPEGK